MSYLIAHFSDFRLSAEDADFERSVAMLDDAIERGADHLVITGDVVEAAEFEVYTQFFYRLNTRGWFHPNWLTVVPGDHDIFPWSTLKLPTQSSPTENYETLVEITEVLREGADCEPLRRRDPFPFGKVLAPGVVLAGLDTTRNGQGNPARWGEGELLRSHVDGVTRFFERYDEATHKIVAMHHYPWAEEDEQDRFRNHNFTRPGPDTVREWLDETGATLVLCGHMHREENIAHREILPEVHAFRAGTAGGIDDVREYEGGNEKCRIYHLIELTDRGKIKIEACRFCDSLLDEMIPRQFNVVRHVRY